MAHLREGIVYKMKILHWLLMKIAKLLKENITLNIHRNQTQLHGHRKKANRRPFLVDLYSFGLIQVYKAKGFTVVSYGEESTVNSIVLSITNSNQIQPVG